MDREHNPININRPVRNLRNPVEEVARLYVFATDEISGLTVMAPIENPIEIRELDSNYVKLIYSLSDPRYELILRPKDLTNTGSSEERRQKETEVKEQKGFEKPFSLFGYPSK